MDWTRTMPRSQGFSPDMADRLDAMVASGALPAIHAIALSRHGKLVLIGPGGDLNFEEAEGDALDIALSGAPFAAADLKTEEPEKLIRDLWAAGYLERVQD